VFHAATTDDAASCWKSDQISPIRASTMPAIREIRVEPVDQTLDEIATPVRGAVEVWLSTLVALARDHRPDVTPA
jgi:hypothetical protein